MKGTLTKATLVTINSHYVLQLCFPTAMIVELGWHVGDEIAIEPVVDRKGRSTHIVLEKS